VTGIGALINRQAGAMRRNPAWTHRMQAMLPPGHVLVTSATEEVVPALEKLRTLGVETLMLCGGDGTVGQTLTDLLENWPEALRPRIVLAPGGTVNTISKSLGANANPVKLLERLVSGGPMRAETQRPLMRARSAEGLVRAGMIFVIGVGVRFLRMYYQDTRPGALGAARVIARVVSSSLVSGRLAREMFSAAPVRIRVDDQTLDYDHFTAMAAGTVRHIGIGFQPFSMADRDPQRFHFAFSDARSSRLVRELPALRRGLIRDDSCVEHHCAKRVTMEFDAPEPWSFDADIYAPTCELTLDTTEPLRFCVP